MTAIRKKLSDVRKEIKALGNVNVNAIEEYRELSERHDFLKTQHEDLVKSAADLQKIIADLDQGMREQFRLQFSRIQREFDQTFRELFGGGKGTLELVEDEDIQDIDFLDVQYIKAVFLFAQLKRHDLDFAFHHIHQFCFCHR